jgi:phage gpG-like protein
LTAALANLGKLPLQLAKIGDLITGEIKRNVSGRILKRRSGDLYNSWQWAVEAINRGWRLIIGSDVVYARIHEFGGWTGANYATKIKKTRYVSKAVMKKKTAVRRVLRDFTAQIWWSHGQH